MEKNTITLSKANAASFARLAVTADSDSERSRWIDYVLKNHGALSEQQVRYLTTVCTDEEITECLHDIISSDPFLR